jgi:hypothetical protein
MNNTLTAKEWLHTNLIEDCVLPNKKIPNMDLDGYTTCSEAMTLYASYRTRELEEKIKELTMDVETYRKVIYEIANSDTGKFILSGDLLIKNNDLNITSETKGKIN